jgi:hypothetical protein
MHINIALLPSDAVRQKAMALSESLSSFGSYFVLDGRDFTPHATVYMTEFGEDNFPIIFTKLQKLISNTAPVAMQAEKYFMNATDYIDIQYHKTDSLMDLHFKTINELSDLRQKLPVDASKYTGPDAELMYQNAKDFGYSIGGKQLYRPHLTLSKMKQPNKDALDSLKWDNFDFQPVQLGFFEADELGACRRLIQAFNFAV